MSLLYISILWVCACVDSAESLVTVSAPVGSTVILPCKLTEDFKQSSVIKWYINNDFVFERSSDGTYSGEGYEGRVDVPLEELRKGNCSLVLKNVSFTDGGLYKTFTMVHVDTNNPEMKEINSVTLSVYEDSVNERGSSSKDSDSHQTGGNNWIIICVVIVIFIIIIIICVFVYYCCVKENRHLSSARRRATDSTEQKHGNPPSLLWVTVILKNENVHCDTELHNIRARKSPMKNKESDLDSVTYTAVDTQPQS